MCFLPLSGHVGIHWGTSGQAEVCEGDGIPAEQVCWGLFQ